MLCAFEDSEANASPSKLVGREITLPGNQVLPVYSGPGGHYLRGADGKSAVSTKEPMTVYAADRDWVLISYSVSSGERFGYIPRSRFPADIAIDHELYQGILGIGLTTREVAVLDNLSEAGKPLCVLPYSTPLDVLATLGEWLYIDAGMFGLGSPCRGFISADAFHHTCNF